MSYPILKPSSSWFTPTVDTITRNIITTINIVDSYTPTETVTDSWDASVAQDGSIMCYVEGTVLTIAGNGSGMIALSPDASWTFSDINTTDYFSVLTQINGATLLDLSSVTTTLRFFNKCVLLQSVDVSQFNLSSCIDTSYMFNSCTMLEVIDVANWDVSKVQTMRCMFQTAQKANRGDGAVKVLDVSKWDTSSCTTMSYMFYGCGNLTELPISNFDVSNVTDFNHIFCDCYGLLSLDIRNWDVSNCNSFNAMFNDCNSIVTIDLTGWNTSNVISFSQMFESMVNLEYIYGLETWDTSSGKNFGEMFRYCNKLKELNLSSFDTSKATHTYKHPNSEYGLTNIFGPEMYALEKVTLGEKWTFLGDGGCTKGYFPTPSAAYIDDADGNWYSSDGNIYTSANVPNLTAGTYYAYPISVIKPNSTWFTPNISTVTRTSITTINIADAYTPTATVTDSWDASVAQNGKIMCYVEGGILTISNNNTDGRKIKTNKDASYMFSDINKGAYFSAVTSINNLSLLDTSTTINAQCMFFNLSKLTSLDCSGIDTSNVTNMKQIFSGCTSLTSINLTDFNTSKVVNMMGMFYKDNKLTSIDLSSFDTSNAENMSYLFASASNPGAMALTTIDLSNFDTSKVTNMSTMFQRCENLHTVIFGDKFDTSNVTDMSYMFTNCKKLVNIDVSNFNTGSVTTMKNMFNQCNALSTLDVSNFDTSMCTDFSLLFNYCSALKTLDLSGWKTDNVTTFQGMFQGCELLNSIDVSKWNTSNVTDVSFMFWGNRALTTLNFENWNVSNITTFDHFLARCSSLAEYDVSKWTVTNKCTNLYAMFHETCVEYLDVSGWDTSNVTVFGQMFELMYNLKEIKGIEEFNTSKGVDFSEMFSNCQNLKELNLSNFDTRNAKKGVSISANGSKSNGTADMFYQAYRLEKVTLGENFTFVGDGTGGVGRFWTPWPQYVDGADNKWYSLSGKSYAPADIPNNVADTYYSSFKLAKLYLDLPELKASNTWFTPTVSSITKSSITQINIVDSYSPTGNETDSWDASTSQDGRIMCYVDGTVLTIAGDGTCKLKANVDSSYMFYESSSSCYSNLTAINGLPMIDFSDTTTLAYMFTRCGKLATVDITKMDVSNVTSMRALFGNCAALTSLDFSSWKTDSLTDMYAMFSSCSNLVSVDMTGWDTSKVTNVAFLFNLCNKLQNFDGTILNAAKPTNYQQMFQQCNVLTELDVSGWDTSNVTNMSFMFYNCDGLTSLAVENWDVRNVESFDHTFAHCNNLVVDVSKWRTTNKCKYYCAMFHSNANTYLDVSGFDTSGAISMFSMFEANYKLKKIDGLHNFDTSNCHAFEEMFNNDYLLEELDLSSFDTRKADSDTTARSDGSTYKSQCTNGMIIGCRSLKNITLGQNFTFAGDGTTTNANYISKLPTPSATYIDGADGHWYTTDGTAYAPADIPNLTYATYYASIGIVDNLTVTVTNGVLRSIANAIRAKNGSTDKYYPGDFAAEIAKL